LAVISDAFGEAMPMWDESDMTVADLLSILAIPVLGVALNLRLLCISIYSMIEQQTWEWASVVYACGLFVFGQICFHFVRKFIRVKRRANHFKERNRQDHRIQ
jgi:hypothetical protein